MENYLLTWLKSKPHSQAEIEGNPTNVLPVEYQDYLNTKETYIQEWLERIFNLFNTLN